VVHIYFLSAVRVTVTLAIPKVVWIILEYI